MISSTIQLVLIVGVLLLIAVANANDDSRCVCKRRFKPVCGTDGKTYNNDCKLNCAKNDVPDIRVAYKGICCPKPHCPRHFQPMCDNYGQTHNNECMFRYAFCIMRKMEGRLLKVTKHEACALTSSENSCKSDHCDEQMEPICDTNGVTHKNMCFYRQAECERRLETTNGGGGVAPLLIAFKGECQTGDMELINETTITITAETEQASSELPTTTVPSLPTTTTTATEATTTTTTTTATTTPATTTTTATSTTATPTTTTTTLTSTTTTTPATTTTSDAMNLWDPLPTTTATINSPVLKTNSSKMAPMCHALGCTKQLAEICDTMGKTHKNKCMFDYYACKQYYKYGVQIAIDYAGACNAARPKVVDECAECMPSLKSPMEVCDNENQTHTNLCELNHRNCRQKAEAKDERILVGFGKCSSFTPMFKIEDEVCPTICTLEYYPICDNEHQTHGNLCAFQTAACLRRRSMRPRIHVVDLGECHVEPAPILMATENAPVATTPSTTASTTAEPAPFQCPEPHCKSVSQPLCDNKGHTHRNPCVFAWTRCLASRQGQSLTIAHDGACEGPAQGNLCKRIMAKTCNDTEEATPVCGDDFKTYASRCVFEQSRCQLQQASGEILEIVIEDTCDVCMDRACLYNPPPIRDREVPGYDENQFVCDSEGMTQTLCEFEVADCFTFLRHGTNLTAMHVGPCCPSIQQCPGEEAPVCDSLGFDHPNRCIFEARLCEERRKNVALNVTVAHVGKCRKEETTTTTTTTTAPLPSTTTQQADTTTIDNLPSPTGCDHNCTNAYLPICGTDEQTYPNECMLEHHKCLTGSNLLTKDYDGRCCDTACPNHWQPVCDIEGKTHKNMCAFETARCLALKRDRSFIELFATSACANDDCKFNCSKQYEPVCGDDEQTYPNECHLMRRSCMLNDSALVVKHPGECCPKKQCPYVYEPVCDSQGKTHLNRCIFEQRRCEMEKGAGDKGLKLTISYTGACCHDAACTKQYQPVCDGNVTYGNLCAFRIAQCEAQQRQGRQLSLAYFGACCIMKSTPECVGNNFQPVCDSLGVTHQSKCQFEYTRCTNMMQLNRTVTLIHNGTCCQKVNCPEERNPVCDNRGKTHTSKCEFLNSKCAHDRRNNNATALEIAYEGECCAATCTEEFQPVCDQNGKVYGNRCLFNIQACRNNRHRRQQLLLAPCPLNRTLYQMRHLLRSRSRS